MKHNLLVFLLFLIIIEAYCSVHHIAATPKKIHDRKDLSHSKVILNDPMYSHLFDGSSLRRHNLASYEQVPLQTDHYGFTLDLKVQGLLYKMSMDTGSSDIFIKGEKSPGSPKKRYQSKQNYKNNPLIRIGYLDGQLKCYSATLNVQFDKKTFKTPLLVAYTAPAQFKDSQGLIGLSYPQLAKHKPTFIQTLIQNKLISKYAYGMNLNLLQQNRSFVTFGDKDANLFTGEMKQYSIGKTTEIIIDFNWVKIGDGGELAVSSALLDTGNTCISIPHQYQYQILKAFKTEGNRCEFQVQQNVPMFSLLICQVKNFDQLPNITLNIQGTQYTIQKQYYLQRCTKNPDQPDYYYCDTYIESTLYERKNMIFLGDGFFNRFYTFFDLENSKVGIATNRENITMSDILKQKFRFKYDDWVEFYSQ